MLTSLPGLVPLVLLLTPLPQQSQSTDPNALTVTNFPGGLVDNQGLVAYVQGAAGNIEAIDLAKGTVLWSNSSFARPLALQPERLIVEAPVKDKPNVVYVAVLDINNKGKLLGVSDPITLPDWANTGTAYGRSYHSSVSDVKDGVLLLSWEAKAWYAGGARPTPEMEKAARKEAHGLAAIDLKTGKVKMREGEKVPPADVVLPPGLEKVESAQYWTGSDWQKKPFVLGPKIVALTRKQVGNEEELELQTWDRAKGKADPPLELLRGKSLWLQLGADKRYLFVHQALPADKLAKGDYAWWAFDLTNGKLAAKVPFEPGVLGITVLAKNIYYVTEQTKLGPKGDQRTRLLKAVDAGNGQLVWQRPLYAPPVLPPLP
jgi:hypothetical protein